MYLESSGSIQLEHIWNPIFGRFEHLCQPPKKNPWNPEMELLWQELCGKLPYTTWRFPWSVQSKSLVLLQRLSLGSSWSCFSFVLWLHFKFMDVAVPGDLRSVPSWVSASVVPDLPFNARIFVTAGQVSDIKYLQMLRGPSHDMKLILRIIARSNHEFSDNNDDWECEVPRIRIYQDDVSTETPTVLSQMGPWRPTSWESSPEGRYIRDPSKPRVG